MAESESSRLNHCFDLLQSNSWLLQQFCNDLVKLDFDENCMQNSYQDNVKPELDLQQKTDQYNSALPSNQLYPITSDEQYGNVRKLISNILQYLPRMHLFLSRIDKICCFNIASITESAVNGRFSVARGKRFV